MSAFKKLFTDLVNADGDSSKLFSSGSKPNIKVFVKETNPYFLVSDSFFYVPAYFTDAAIKEYQSKFPQVNVLDLEGKVIVITKWTLELRKVNSKECFTSYAGVECRLIVHSFKPQLQLKQSLHPTRYPTNLYRDDEFKTSIQAFRHSQVCAAAASKKVEMAPITGGKGQVQQGILANSCGEWQFKEGNTKVVALGGKSKKQEAAQGARVVKGKKASAKKAAAKAGGKGAAAVDAVVAGGKKVAKKSVGKKSASQRPPATPEGRKSTQGSAGRMTVQQYRKFLNNMKKK